MNTIFAHYQHREAGNELVNHSREINLFREACEVIDHYPWARELELFEALGVGGSLTFVSGDFSDCYASYQLTPIDTDKALMALSIVAKKGFLNVFGRKSVTVDFDEVSIAEAKSKLKSLFECSIDHLYNQHRK